MTEKLELNVYINNIPIYTQIYMHIHTHTNIYQLKISQLATSILAGEQKRYKLPFYRCTSEKLSRAEDASSLIIHFPIIPAYQKPSIVQEFVFSLI